MAEARPDWKAMDEETRLSMVKAMALDRMPASEIALRFQNATRMSVIGLCARKKLQLRGRAPKPPAPPKKPQATKPKAPKVEARISVREVAIARANGPRVEADPDGLLDLGNDVTGLLGIMDLKAHHCRYIHGDPKNVHGYCGQTAQAGSSFCPDHHDRVYLGSSR